MGPSWLSSLGLVQVAGLVRILTDPVDVTKGVPVDLLSAKRSLSIDLASAVAVSRMQPPNASFELLRARAEGQLQRYQRTSSRSAPLPPCSSCSLHMFVILPAGANRMNSCRSTANHASFLSALQAACRTISRALELTCTASC